MAELSDLSSRYPLAEDQLAGYRQDGHVRNPILYAEGSGGS